MQYDVIAVGAGPAGLTSAMTAAQGGMKVLLVDTKENIARQTRPCCSMWLLEPGFHNEAWTFADDKIIFHRNDFSIPYSGATIALHRSVRITAQGHTMTMGKQLTPVARVIDKEKLLQGLLARAVETGVEVRPKTTCIGIREHNTGVEATLRHHDSSDQVTGKYLLAADGVDSRIAEQLGLNRNRSIIIRTRIIHYYYAGVNAPYADAWVQFIGNGFNGVSGTLLRKPDRDGESNIYEVGVLPPKGSGIGLKEGMQRLISHPVVKEWFTGARLIKKTGCLWTCWTPIHEPARGRTIIVGDGASFQEVENQGAIMCGLNAARAIAAQLRGEDGFGAYNRFWQNSFEFNDPKILNDTWRAFIFQQLDSRELDYLVSLAEGRVLDGYVNHFTCGNVIMQFVTEQMDRIKREQPELAEKIKKMGQFKMEDHLIGDTKS